MRISVWKDFIVNNFLIIGFGLAAVILAGLGVAFITPNPARTIPVEIAYKVTHQPNKPGDIITIPVPPTTTGTIYAHFPLESPCMPGSQNLAGTLQKPPSCIVTVPAIARYIGQYPWYIDSSPIVIPSLTEGRCRTCCTMCQIVIPNLNAKSVEKNNAIAGSGPLSAAQIIIDQTESDNAGVPWGLPTTVRVGQTVKWFQSGVNLDWSITLDDPKVCRETQAGMQIGIKDSQICTVAAVSSKAYGYFITAHGKRGRGSLTVN